MNKQPSLFKIIMVDYMAFVGAIAPVSLWGVYIFLLLTKREDISNLTIPIIFGVLTVLGLILLVWRIILINNIFTDGIEANAAISRVFFFRDRGKIECVYSYLGEKYVSSNKVMKFKFTTTLRSGMEVVVMVDRNKPKRAFIRDLYL